MDDRTADKLKGMGDMSRDVRRRLFKQVETRKEERESLERASYDKRLPIKKRENLKKELEDPKYYNKELRIDPKASAELNRRYEAKIQQGFRDGSLKRPDPNDPLRRKLDNLNK